MATRTRQTNEPARQTNGPARRTHGPAFPRSVECAHRMPNHTIRHPSTAPLTLIDIGINLGHDSYESTGTR